MGDPRRRALAAAGVALVVTVFLTWAVATGGTVVLHVDESLSDFTRAWAVGLGWPIDLSLLVGRVTAPLWSVLAAVVLCLALLRTRHHAAAALLALSGILGVATSEAIKTLMGRQRPPGADQFVSDLDRSFPSGHAMEGVYLYVTAGLILIHLGRGSHHRWLGRIGTALVIAGPIIGISRIVLGVHWPSDVVAGWANGSIVLLGVALALWDPLARGWAPATPTPTSAEPPASLTRPGPGTFEPLTQDQARRGEADRPPTDGPTLDRPAP